jgi:hypothetical protein
MAGRKRDAEAAQAIPSSGYGLYLDTPCYLRNCYRTLFFAAVAAHRTPPWKRLRPAKSIVKSTALN